jgi:carbon monoxide dehydrogenase subunit G
MASIFRSFTVRVPATHAWQALGDVGALHTRLVKGFVRDTRMEGSSRIVTFANGTTVTERILSIDEAHRRLAYSATGGRATHHNASVQILDDGADSCRIVWITDLLPDEMQAQIEAMVDAGIAAMRRTLEDSLPRAV